MLDKAIEVLEKLEEKGFTAYIVGGFVRDYLIKRETTDEKELELSDLIASLTIGSNTYNMSNVWDLTYYAFQD